ncbi:hypothetical protein Efla_004812 [Eimeria flavescens]
MRGPLMKPLRTPDMQRKRQQQQQQQQQQQHGRPLSLKQQIEQQHQQQLVPWSSSQPPPIRSSPPTYSSSSSSSSSSSGRQLYVAAAGSPLSPGREGPSPDVVPFEEVAQQMLQSGGPVRRLRFSGSRHAKSLLVGKLPDRLKSLTQPISITRDIPLLPPDTDPHVLTAAAAAAPWRLRDSSDAQPPQQEGEQQQAQQQHQQQQQGEAAGSSPAVPSRRPQQKAFVTRKNEVDASCFFLLVEGQGVLDVLPVAEFLTFERTLGSQQPPPEELEQRSKAQACLEAALTQRAAGLRKGSDSDEETRKAEEEAAQRLSEGQPKQGQQKRIHQLEAVTWDFEEGERSDDEGGEAPQDAKDQQEETLQAEPVETESEEDAGDPLTSFGQKMKSLLDKAREDEADAELHQYESDDEEEETAEEKGQEGTPASSSSAAGGPPSEVGQRAPSSAVSRGPQGVSASQQGPPPSGAPQQAAGAPKETLEAKVVRVMQQHMGRMAVKDFMHAFKVKQKNEEFKRIQAVVHKVCKMEATEDKQNSAFELPVGERQGHHGGPLEGPFWGPLDRVFRGPHEGPFWGPFEGPLRVSGGLQ